MADDLARIAIKEEYITYGDGTYITEDDLYEEHDSDLITYRPEVLRKYKLLHDYYYDKLLNDSL